MCDTCSRRQDYQGVSQYTHTAFDIYTLQHTETNNNNKKEETLNK